MTPRKALQEAEEASKRSNEERAVLYLRALVHLAFAIVADKVGDAAIVRKTTDG